MIVHERLSAEDAEILEASPRSFGHVFAVVFAVIAVWPLANGGGFRLWSGALAAFMLVAARAAPALLRPFSRAWQRIGLLLHRVVNPIVVGVLFYLAVTPFGLAMRVCGAGLRRNLTRDPNASSYWVHRKGMPPSRMQNQF